MDLVAALVFILPCYVANAAPVLLGGGAPLDFGAKWGDGKRLFGKTKTMRGFVGGVAAGTLAAGVLVYAHPLAIGAHAQMLSGIALSFGALIGDVLGSFIKRRMGLGEGEPFLLDQLDFVLVGLLLAYPFAASTYDAGTIVFILILTYLLHIAANFAANRLGLKSVPW